MQVCKYVLIILTRPVPGGGVQFDGLGLVAQVEGVGRHQVVSLQYLSKKNVVFTTLEIYFFYNRILLPNTHAVTSLSVH